MSATGVSLVPADDADVSAVAAAAAKPAEIEAASSEPTTVAQQSDATPNDSAPLALAIAPEGPTKPALAAVNQFSADGLADGTARTAKGQPGLARLFSFAKPRQNLDLGKTTMAGRGATSRDPRSLQDPAPGTSSLPGVRVDSLFGVSNGKPQFEDEPVRVASAAGLARLAPHGLKAQSEKVQMGCFKPELLRLLDTVRRHYGRDIVVTSGYRSPKHNRKAGGAKGSRHTTCEAADIQVPGVSKSELAKYLRTIRGRGGVGTYCHTKSVHIDVGTKRDWNWRCRRR